MAADGKQNCKTMTDCLSSLCCSDDMADVLFLFPENSNKRISAHKFPLAVRSPVFKAMFFGSLPEVEREVVITDVSADTFTLLLRYIYTDEVALDGNNVTPILHAAIKYALNGLVKQCEGYLECAIDPENACVIFNQATFFGMQELANTALLCMEVNATDVFDTEGFDSLSNDNFRAILKSERLKAKEIDIFNASIKWAKAKSMEQRLEVNGQNLRKVLGDLLFLIRIPLLSLQEYSQIVVRSGILTSDEQLLFYKYFTLKEEENIEIPKFSSQPRDGTLPFALDVDDLITSHVGQKSIETFCFETITIKTKVPLKLRQITMLPIPDFMSGQSNIDYNPTYDCLPNNVSIVVKNASVEPPQVIHQGDHYPLKGSSIRLEYTLGVYPENKLKISVTRFCQKCGILHSPPYRKINMISSRYGNRMTQRAPLKSLSICDTQVDISFMGQHLVQAVTFEQIIEDSPENGVADLTQHCKLTDENN